MKLPFRFPREIIATLLIILSITLAAAAQTGNVVEMRAKAVQLMAEQKTTEALPLLEVLIDKLPNDSLMQYHLGFALLGTAANTADEKAAKSYRARARQAFIKARDLGDDSQLVHAMIESLPEDGSDTGGYSPDPRANKLMLEGEAAFSSGKMDEALAAYQNALKFDPKLYHAALFTGDVYTHTNKYADAEIWYQKAIAIDPTIETAYRYSATPLMKQGKTAEARDRYVEAFIVAPYSRLALGGLLQWGQATDTQLAHPRIDLPEITFGPDGKAKSTINVDPAAMEDGLAWGSYISTREAWRKEKFAKAYPKESAYRHSLMEEADALRSVVNAAKALKAKAGGQISMIEKMDKDGVLEAFILMAKADRGIAADHADYLRQNREKLRLYVVKYVIGGGK